MKFHTWMSAFVFTFFLFNTHLTPQELGVLISVEADGLYEVGTEDLRPVIDPMGFDLDQLSLRDGQKLVPLYFRNTDGARWRADSSFVFYSTRGNTEFSRRRTLRLVYDQAPPRITQRRSSESSGEVVETEFVFQRFEEDLIFDGMETIRPDVLALPASAKDHWFWRRIPPAADKARPGQENSQSFALTLSPAPVVADALQGVVNIGIRSHWSHKATQSMRITVNGRDLGEQTWTESGRHMIQVPLPPEAIQRILVVELRNTSNEIHWEEPQNQVAPRRRNDILVDWIGVQYRAMLVGPSARENGQTLVDLTAMRLPEQRSLRFRSLRAEPLRIFEPASASFAEGQVFERTDAEPRRLVLLAADGFRKPVEIRKRSPRNLRTEVEGGDWVVITLERFREVVRMLADHRTAQGLKPIIVTDREVYDAYSGGAFTPHAIRDFLSAASSQWKIKPRYVLLVGDADLNVDWVSKKPVLPTQLVPTFYNGQTASDAAFLADPFESEIRIGRFAVREPEEALRIIQRLIKYENKPGADLWRRRLSFVASEGRFGPLVDPIIESFVVDMLSKNVPAAYDINMTYANPSSQYVFAPRGFNAKVIERFNEGSLFFTYIGHGYRRGLDALQIAREKYPILTMDDIEKIDSEDRPPVMAVIACSTAQFDDPNEDCITEEMLRRRGGPAAVIASTRVSHPFANALFGKGLIQSFFGGAQRIGDVLGEAKIRMVKDWRQDPIASVASSFVAAVDKERLLKDHVHLYTLLGDPAMTIPRPPTEITLEVPAEAAFGDTVVVRGTLPEKLNGIATLTIECRRQDIIHPIERVNLRDPADDPKVAANYDNANNKVLLGGDVEIKDGVFEATMTIPEARRAGVFIVKAAARCDHRLSLGSAAIKIVKPEQK